MTDKAVQDQLLALTKLKTKEGETAAQFTERVLDKVNKMADASEVNWNKLDELAQTWVNENVVAKENNAELKLLVLEEQGEADPEEDEEAPPAKADPGDDAAEDEEEAPVPAKKVAVKKVAAAKKAPVKKPVAAKAAPAKKEPKAAKPVKTAKVAKGDRGRDPLFPDTGVIKVLAKANPHREGTIRDKAFKKVKTGMTVAEAVKAGCPRQQVWSMAHRQLISVTAPRS